MVKPIETRYAGHRFRSRLEARWAVFFDTVGIPWQYEPEGYELSDGRGYLPDFLLTECSTWVEVKGAAESVDMPLLRLAARELPLLPVRRERGPRLMLLGPIPAPAPPGYDYGWRCLSADPDFDTCAGFSHYGRNVRPWWMSCSGHADLNAVTPCLSRQHDDSRVGYTAARSARFEHGETGR